MTTHEVLIEPSRRDGEITTTIDGVRRGFKLGTERLSANLLAEPDDRLLDLLEIAGGLFAADGAIRRGPDTRPDMGERWRRSFLIHVDVRQPEFWAHPEVSGALSDLVDLMSEDTAEFQFSKAKFSPPIQRYVPLEDAEEFGPIENVVMFSGGLDSLAGAIEMLEAREGRVALVTHLSSQKRMPMQRRLSQRMIARYGNRVIKVPLMARRKGGKRFPETTQRTRTLLLGAIGTLVHDMLGGRRIAFFENGVVSQNLPISPQVIGSMATRTTHPAVIEHLRHLLSLVCDHDVDLRTPYEWLTKTEVVQRLDRFGAAKLIPETFSCSSVFERSVEAPHCGVCSQCLDRRVGILAAGLAEHDRPDGYDTDPLAGERSNDRDMTMAVEWIRHAYRMKDVSRAELEAAFGLELAKIAEGYPGRAVDDVMAETLQMQRRHGQAVEAAVAGEIRDRAVDLARGRLHPTAPILLLSPSGDPSPSAAPPRESEPAPPSEPPSLDKTPPADLFPLQVWCQADHPKRPWMRVFGLGDVHSKHVRVVEPLRHAHAEDLREQRVRDRCRFIAGGAIAQDLAVTKRAVSTDVKRVRSALAEFYEAIAGAPPPQDLLIQSRAAGGYRIDPDARFVDPEKP